MTDGAPLVSKPRNVAEYRARLSPLLDLLRCLECGSNVRLESLSARDGYPNLGPDGWLRCDSCGESYPLIAGTARMLPPAMRARLRADYPRSAEVFDGADFTQTGTPLAGELGVKQLTADSFAYEWRHFGGLRDAWRKNFLDYMQPHTAESFAGRNVLDVGAGSGRHSFHAAGLGSQVVAVDLGRSIDVARRNLPAKVLTVQADAESLPFAPATFDYVMSIGVLHHLSNPDQALRRIVSLARPGGHVHVYVYWVPERAFHARVLRFVSAARRTTVRMPHALLHALCVPLAAVLMIAVVAPYRWLRRIPRLRKVADAFPLKTYADYPFGVLVNDQFDRLSAPLERRYTRAEAAALLEAAGLAEVVVRPNFGWVIDGRVAGADSPTLSPQEKLEH